MLLTAKMRYIQIMTLEKDFQKTLDLLAETGWVEIKREDRGNDSNKFKNIGHGINEIEKEISEISEFLNIPKISEKGELKSINEICGYFHDLYAEIQHGMEKLKLLSEKKSELEKNIKELELIKKLNLPVKELESFNFIHFIMGFIEKEELEIVTKNMGGRLLYEELEKNFYIFFTSNKGRWTLESELKKTQFKEKKTGFETNIVPKEKIDSINREINEIDSVLNEIDKFKEKLLKNEYKKIYEMIRSFNLQKAYINVYETLSHSETTTVIEGWVLNKKIPVLTEKINSISGCKVSIISYAPDELEEVRDKKIKVPVFMENLFIFKPFEELIFNYGAPSYRTFDPTMIVAVTYIFMFGFMFGDIGQGLIIFLAGLLLSHLKSKKTEGIKKLSPILVYCGISSMIFGYLYGSIFCFEHVESIFTPVNSLLFGINKPYLFDTSAHNVINLILITILLGIIINMAGIIINIINKFIQKNIGEAILSRYGIAGLIFLCCFLGIYIHIAFVKLILLNYLIIVLATSLVFIIIKEPLVNILKKKRPVFHEGVWMWMIFSIVEILEVFLITFSNNMSFMRVGVFALNHTILSEIITAIASTMGNAGIIIIIFGNVIIIGLEGLIVNIQTLRLEYYEFFSKFFTEKGKRFIPFKIDKYKFKENL